MKDYLSTLLDFINKNIKEGKSKEEIEGLNFIPGYEYLNDSGTSRLKNNLSAAYEELSSD